ncbi:MAG TPA: hypothetical protein VFY82_04065 [Acidimicrobiales bacterium]|nr:hypothetical protein [Acidimicrobiales bacterium]
MSKRVMAVAAAVVAAVVAVGAGAPASAQTYPPPVRSITVDDTTPAPGQAITITLRTCRAGTIALLGIDLKLVAAPAAGADGVASATVTVPRHLQPGRHVVSGACLSPDLLPLFLTTVITVSASGSGAAPSGDGGVAAASPPAAGGGGTGGGAATGADGSTGAGGAAPSLAGLAGPDVPADAASLFVDTAAANGITAEGVTGEGATGAEDDVAMAQRSGSSTPASTDDDPGVLATIARVTLGLAALGGVPVALAISRRPSRTVRRGFAT